MKIKHPTHLRKICGATILSAAALFAITPLSARAAFTIGNLAVEQLAVNGNSSTFSIVELSPYATNATPVNTIAIPSTGASALRQSSSASDGRLALTADRTLLAFTGAEDPTGVSDETTILPRGAGTVNASGAYVLQASYTGVSGNQARGATSLDNQTWYFADKGGIYTNGMTSPANGANVRPVKTFGGVVYALSANSPTLVVSSVSADGTTLTPLPGLSHVDANALDFYMVASQNNGPANDILYVNDGTKLSKYSLVSGTWVSNGPPASLGVTADGLCAQYIGATGTNAFLFVTTGTGGTVVKIIDAAGYNAAPSINTAKNTVLYAGAPYLKGIDFAPTPNLATEQLAQNTTSTQFSIVELNPTTSNAAPVDTITIPITGPTALRQANNGSTGRLALTSDRTLLAFTAAQDGVGMTDETSVNLRGVGTIDSTASGDYTLQATYTGIGGSTKNQTRGATSLNNLTWYIGDKGGIYTNNTSNPVNTTNVRPIRCFGGKIYVCAATSGSASPSVVNTLSVDATTLTPLPGLESALDGNALDFYMIQSGVNSNAFDIAYVNDGAFVSKYSLVSGTWVSNGPPAALGVAADGICTVNIGGAANIYVTTGTAGSVVMATDTNGWNAPPYINTANNVVLFTGGAPYLKGLDFAPVGSPASQSGNTPPVLTPAASATVDNSFIVTFTDPSNWRLSITNVTVNSVTLPTAAYNTTVSGEIIFTPSASVLLQSSGTKTIVIGATTYNQDSVSQAIGAGAPKQLAVSTQPAAPAGNGGTLVTQPVVQVSDQYGNPATNATTFTASVGSGAWTFGTGSGTVQPTVAGLAVFTNLSTSSAGAVLNTYITFTVSGSGLAGLPSTTINSAAFNIPAPATAFTPGNLAVEQEDLATKNSTFSILELSPTQANQSSAINTFAISATGSNALRQTSASTTGRLATSADGTLLSFTGFLDGTSLTADEATIDPRGVGTLDGYGNFVLQTTYTGLGDATGNQTRSATSLDNMTWFIGDKGGVYTNNQTANSPFIGGTGSNVRSLKCFGGGVYALQQFSTSLTATVLQMIYNNGGAEELYPMDGFPEDATVSDFYMLQSGNNGSTYDTVYFIDGTNSTSGRLFKYYLAGTDDNGFPAYALAGSVFTTNGGDGMCAAINPNGGVDIYYTTGNGGAAGNSLYTMHDAAAWNQPINLTSSNVLYNASAAATLKGVAFAPAAPPAAPTATSLPASSITASSATMNASVNPNGAATGYWFQYGTDTSYGSTTVTNILPAGYTPVNVTGLLTGLLQGTGYHYQIMTTNVIGNGNGADASFTTLAVTRPLIGGMTFTGGMNAAATFTFTNATGASFSVLGTNNIAAPVNQWPVVGTAIESPTGSGQYQFTDLNPATNGSMFYILRQP